MLPDKIGSVECKVPVCCMVLSFIVPSSCLLQESREGTPLYTTTETHGLSSRPSTKRSRQRTPQDLDEAESPPAKYGSYGIGRGRTVTKRGRNITRPARHFSDDDIELSSDDEELSFRYGGIPSCRILRIERRDDSA